MFYYILAISYKYASSILIVIGLRPLFFEYYNAGNTSKNFEVAPILFLPCLNLFWSDFSLLFELNRETISWIVVYLHGFSPEF